MIDNSKIFTRKKIKKYDEENNQIDESKINNLETIKNNSNYKGNELNTAGLFLLDKRYINEIFDEIYYYDYDHNIEKLKNHPIKLGWFFYVLEHIIT